jgi:hypothetical protein
MLTPELMGSALLSLSWLTALLIALDALIDARALLARLRAWRTTLVAGTVEADELAVHEVEQRVRLFDGRVPTLGFFDRAHVSRLRGGAVRVGDEVLEVTAGPDAEVWTQEAARHAAAGCPDAAAFDALAAQAKGAAGALRTVHTRITRGATVWLAGTRDGQAFRATLASDVDPRRWARAKLWLLLGLVVLDVAWVALGTALALWPPVFGLVSKAGAVVLVGHFLGLTPIAMALREKVRPPATAFLRGEWQRAV